MSIRFVSLATLLLLLGPPGIKIDSVTNPATAPVRGAVLMITARHHQSPEGFTVSGRAEGIVAGKRVTRALSTTPVPGSENLFGVLRQWDAGQPWILVFTVKEEGHDTNGFAEAMVSVTADGKIGRVEYPMGQISPGVPWPRRVTGREVDAALEALSPRH
jgi:hypothetical protein